MAGYFYCEQRTFLPSGLNTMYCNQLRNRNVRSRGFGTVNWEPEVGKPRDWIPMTEWLEVVEPEPYEPEVEGEKEWEIWEPVIGEPKVEEPGVLEGKDGQTEAMGSIEPRELRIVEPYPWEQKVEVWRTMSWWTNWGGVGNIYYEEKGIWFPKAPVTFCWKNRVGDDQNNERLNSSARTVEYVPIVSWFSHVIYFPQNY